MHVLVNNETALTFGGRVGQTTDLTTIKTIGRHSAGNISGLSINEYVALPARARISFSFECDHVGEGFIQLRKL